MSQDANMLKACTKVPLIAALSRTIQGTNEPSLHSPVTAGNFPFKDGCHGAL